MSTNTEKTYSEADCLKDAMNALGIQKSMPTIDMDRTSTILFPHVSSESISLARALYDIQKIHWGKWVFTILVRYGNIAYRLDDTWLHPVDFTWTPAFNFLDESQISSSNAKGFDKYSDNKLFWSMILMKNNIPTPRQTYIKQSRFSHIQKLILSQDIKTIKQEVQKVHNKTHAKIVDFLSKSSAPKFVIKPYNWKQWDGVQISDKKSFEQVVPSNEMFGGAEGHIILVQDKIESYPLSIDGDKKDWNMRVLVTYDIATKTYISAGIVCRVDALDKPVNISISASFHSFDYIMDQLWIKDRQSIEESIKNTATSAVSAIVEYAHKKLKKPDGAPDFQVLAWVDIILDPDGLPIVLEVNDMHSGCNYELMKLHGVEALYPIAHAILAKATLNELIQGISKSVLGQVAFEPWDKFTIDANSIRVDDVWASASITVMP